MIMQIQKHITVKFILVIMLGAFVVGTVFADDKNTNYAPKVPFKYAFGKKKFQEMCSSCHGKWGFGTDHGPPLMHPFYKPSHHDDAAFYRATLKGVKAHHWQFGDMPPVSGATAKDIDIILPYIRWLQRENKFY